MKRLFVFTLFILLLAGTYFMYEKYSISLNNSNQTENLTPEDKKSESFTVNALDLIHEIPGAKWRYTGVVSDGSLSIMYSGALEGDAYFFPATVGSKITLPEVENVTFLVENINKESEAITVKMIK